MAIATLAVGCAAPAPPRPVVMARPAPATRPGDPKMWLPLAQIPDAPVLVPPTQPATAPAPMAALLLYARAREAELDDNRVEATRLLERACQIDPDSYELQYSLARMYAAGGQEVAADDAQSLAALELAGRIEPDHLRLQIDLGREYLQHNNAAEAMRHLRLALQTTEYREDDALSAIADFLLASALDRQNYLRASLDEYRLLFDRLRKPTMAMRANGELGVLLLHIDSFESQIGELEEKLGEYAKALATFQSLLDRDPGNLPVASRVVACLLGCNRPADAVSSAAHLVEQHPASTEALRVLDEACQGANDLGYRASLSEEYARLYQAHPANHTLLFAWIDALQKERREAMAMKALESAWASDPYDPQLIRRRFALIRTSADPEQGGAGKAAQMLIAMVAQHPALAEQVEPLWDELLRSGRLPYLTFDQLQSLPDARGQESAKAFFVAYAAEAFGRESAAESALARANSTGAYAPAAREQLETLWAAGDLSDAQKADQSEALARRAAAAGNNALASELRGLGSIHQKRPSLSDFAAAHAADNSPQLFLEYCLAMKDEGQSAQFEQSMWSLVSDWPGFGQSYIGLLNFYLAHEQDEPAQNVVRKWLSADPDSPVAQRIEALQLLNSGQTGEAQAILSRLLTTDGNDPMVLDAAIALQEQNGAMEPLLDRLNRDAKQDPKNVALAGALAMEYAKLRRPGDAQRVLDAAAAALAADPDMLYQLSGFYHHAHLEERSEQMLSAVLQLDPDDAGAANDLGYYWADSTTHLPQAEALVRRAIAVEPHNTAFLDSLGWVLYKLGKFDQASGYLTTAATPRESADPVVLNHLGDALYRLGQPGAAGAAWQTAAGKITDHDDQELLTLRAQLIHKSQQLKSNQPVDVAPIVAATTQR